MKLKSYISLCAIGMSVLLSGCASTTTASIGEGINSILTGVSEGVKAGLGTTNTNNQVTDWTFYLAPMQEGCDYPYMNKNVPNVLAKSVDSVYRKGNPEMEMDEVTYYFNLKNAVAFGYPITRVEYLQGYEWSHLKVVFEDSSFTKLRPSFKLPEIDNKYMSVQKNNSKGYEAETGGYVFLDFDTEDNSITCGSGV